MEENTTKEINLLQLITLFLNWIKNMLMNLLRFGGYLLRLCYRRKITVIIVLVISVVIGQYFARKSNRVYKAEAMAMLYGSDASTVKEVCKQIENSLSNYKLTSLATKLSLPDSVANNITEIHSFYVIDYLKDKTPDKIDFGNNHSLTDTLNVPMQDRIYLQIKTKNINQVPQVQAAILNFFNTNSVIKNQFINRKNEYLQRIQICDTELQRIDSLAKVSYFKDKDKQIRFENNKLLVGDQMKQLFYENLLRLQEVKALAQVKLTNYIQPVDLLSGFVVNPTPLNGRVTYGIYSLLIGFILAVIIAGLIENIKKIFDFLNKK
ncbi:MAG: hypothetical protein ACYC25_05135 [Paludibacter sp.]